MCRDDGMSRSKPEKSEDKDLDGELRCAIFHPAVFWRGFEDLILSGGPDRSAHFIRISLNRAVQPRRL